MRIPNGIINQRTVSILMACATIALIGMYLRIHASLLATPWPITVREAAFILQTEALLDPSAPPMYSPESTPDNVNLYGPLYPLAAAPLAALFPNQPYLAHRLTVALFLLGTCLLLGWALAKHSRNIVGFAAAGIFYAATVATPSVAAGPDTLATFLYVAAIVIFTETGPTIKGISAAICVGLLALLAKPYAVWIIPCVIAYITWAHSIRRGIYCALGTIIVSAMGAWLVATWWPEYFFSVFLIHSASASRYPEVLTSQLLEFSWLNFAPIALLLLLLPYRQFLRQALRWRWHSGKLTIPPLDHRPTWCVFMALAALLPLLLSLGWHGGAHIIYFNHLLLAPLLIAALTLEAQVSDLGRSLGAKLLVVANIALLITFIPPPPPLPKAVNLSNAGKVLVDPVLEPVRRLYPGADVVDNAQTEYWIRHAKEYGNKDRQARARQWETNLTNQLNNRVYDTLLLANPYAHSRPALLTTEGMSDALIMNYDIRGKKTVPAYFLPFRNREAYGIVPLTLFVFSKKSDADTRRE